MLGSDRQTVAKLFVFSHFFHSLPRAGHWSLDWCLLVPADVGDELLLNLGFQLLELAVLGELPGRMANSFAVSLSSLKARRKNHHLCEYNRIRLHAGY
jgi:hypothetical protein